MVVLDPSEQYTFHAEGVIVEVKHTGLVVDVVLRLGSRYSTSVLSCGVCGDKDSNCVLLVGRQSADDSAIGSGIVRMSMSLQVGAHADDDVSGGRAAVCSVILHHFVAIFVCFRHVLGSNERVLSANSNLISDNWSAKSVSPADAGYSGGKGNRRQIAGGSVRRRKVLLPRELRLSFAGTRVSQGRRTELKVGQPELLQLHRRILCPQE
jgi:hypothetical protein